MRASHPIVHGLGRQRQRGKIFARFLGVFDHPVIADLLAKRFTL
jgi:hypothetical protein